MDRLLRRRGGSKAGTADRVAKSRPTNLRRSSNAPAGARFGHGHGESMVTVSGADRVRALDRQQHKQRQHAAVSEARERLGWLKRSVTGGDGLRQVAARGRRRGGGGRHADLGDHNVQRRIADRKAAVCRITRADGAFGTGFLAAFEQHAVFVTTHAFLPTAEAAGAATFEFDVEDNPAFPGTMKEPFACSAAPRALFVTFAATELDVTVVGCAAQLSQNGHVLIGKRMIVPVPMACDGDRAAAHFGASDHAMPDRHYVSSLPQHFDELHSVGHADGAPKATTSTFVGDVAGPPGKERLQYAAGDASPADGCSGSPVFDGAWELCGLHNQREGTQGPGTVVPLRAVLAELQRWYNGVRQQMVLSDIYVSCGGDAWQRNDKWLDEAEPAGRWHGVRADDQGNVIEVSLRSNRLKGRVPPTLRQCTRLWKLDLSDNELHGSSSLPGLPHELGQCQSLRSLKLRGNPLSCPIPPSLAQLRNLQVLWLSRCQLIGTIPHALGALSELRSLYMSHNELQGSIPASLGDLRNLELLDLGYNALTGPIPDSLGYLFNLRELYLFNNQLSGSVPESFINLKCLCVLGLTKNGALHGLQDTREMLLEEYGHKHNLKLV